MMASITIVVILSSLVTYFWRGIGVAIGQRINPEGEIFEWIGCVAYAMLAGLMARVLILPVGLLAETSLLSRVVPMAVGFALFFYFRRSWLSGTIGSIATFFSMVHLGL